MKAMVKLILITIKQLKDVLAAACEELSQFKDEQAAASEREKWLVKKLELEAVVQRTEDEVEELSEVAETEKKRIEIRMKQFKKLYTSTASQAMCYRLSLSQITGWGKVVREIMESEGKYPVM